MKKNVKILVLGICMVLLCGRGMALDVDPMHPTVITWIYYLPVKYRIAMGIGHTARQGNSAQERYIRDIDGAETEYYRDGDNDTYRYIRLVEQVLQRYGVPQIPVPSDEDFRLGNLSTAIGQLVVVFNQAGRGDLAKTLTKEVEKIMQEEVGAFKDQTKITSKSLISAIERLERYVGPMHEKVFGQ